MRRLPLILPETPPGRSPQALWELQQWLLHQAQKLLGPADSGKKILRPKFTVTGPVLRNTANLKGAYAELSLNARTYWPSVVFELAHETVHLLNPVAGNGNRLEEGIATAFSDRMQRLFDLPVIQSPARGAYYNAWQWVEQLPGGPFAAARRLRKRYGALGAITPAQMMQTLPQMEPQLAQRLGRKFYRTPARKRQLKMP